MSRLKACAISLLVLCVSLGIGNTSQPAWAQDDVTLDHKAMAKECRRLRDRQCEQVCRQAMRGVTMNDQRWSEKCHAAYNEMRARQPKQSKPAVPEHPVLGLVRIALEREAETRANFRAELDRVKPGFVYKTRAYWIELLTGDDRGWMLDTDDREVLLYTIRDTFDGIFFTKGASVSDFPLLYRGFTRSYGRRCRDILEDPISITITRTETDQYGYEKKEIGAPFIIEKSFYQKFDAYEPIAIDYTARAGLRGAMSGASMGAIQGRITRHDDTVDRVLAGLSCTSATMRQLRMNFWLRAHDKPSLQESGERIAGAEAESQVDVLKAKIADFDAKMAALRDPASKRQKHSLIDPPTKTDGEQGIEIAYLYDYGHTGNWPFESHIRTWLAEKGDGMNFVRVPSSPNMYASGFYSAKKFGIEQEIHDAIFEAIHMTRRAPAHYRALRELFEKHGVAAADFDEAMKSSDVKKSVSDAEKIFTKHLHSEYSWSDLPIFLVNGKYRVSTATCLCGPEEMLAIVTELAQKAD